MTEEKLLHLLIPTLQEGQNLRMTPCVQVDAPNPRRRHSIRSMSSTAIHTKQDAVCDTRPFWGGTSTVHTACVARNLEEKPLAISWKGEPIMNMVGILLFSEIFQLAGSSLDDGSILLLLAAAHVKTESQCGDAAR